jgi:hypothetical protein
LNVVDIVIAPSAAFERLRVLPSWGWGFLAASLLGIAGTLLAVPAQIHAFHQWLPGLFAATPSLAKLPADQQTRIMQAQLSWMTTMAQLGWILVPFVLLIVGAIQALAMTAANAIGNGDGTFAKYFALSMNVAVVGNGLALIVMGLIATLRGPEAFDSPSAVQAATPGLALLAPSAGGAARGFLVGFNVFYVWATVLLALGMERVGRIPRTTAWTTALLLLVLTAAFTAFGARQG